MGSFSLINKIFGSPSSIFGPFILERFKKDINYINENGENMLKIFNKIFSILTILSLTFFTVSIILLFIKIPNRFFLETENFNIILLFILFSIRFIISPLTYFIYFTKKIHYDLLIQILHLIFISCFVFLPFKINPIDYLNVIQIIIYSFYFFLLRKTLIYA